MEKGKNSKCCWINKERVEKIVKMVGAFVFSCFMSFLVGICTSFGEFLVRYCFTKMLGKDRVSPWLRMDSTPFPFGGWRHLLKLKKKNSSNATKLS